MKHADAHEINSRRKHIWWTLGFPLHVNTIHMHEIC